MITLIILFSFLVSVFVMHLFNEYMGKEEYWTVVISFTAFVSFVLYNVVTNQ